MSRKTMKNSKLQAKINQKEYNFYVVDLYQNKIISGYEYRSDANDYSHERNKEMIGVGTTTVYSSSYVITRLQLDPNNNDSWGTDKPAEPAPVTYRVEDAIVTQRSSYTVCKNGIKGWYHTVVFMNTDQKISVVFATCTECAKREAVEMLNNEMEKTTLEKIVAANK